jgi:uncharacterized SAM-binding protein YcdF (DUF218 family)
LPAVVLEEHAMTTLENLIFARGLAEHHGRALSGFVVFCDRVHQRKVATLARLILGARAIVQPVDHEVPALDRLFEPVSYFIEAFVARVPRLRKYLRAAAIFAKGVSGNPPDSALPPLLSDDQPQHRRAVMANATITDSSSRP